MGEIIEMKSKQESCLKNKDLFRILQGLNLVADLKGVDLAHMMAKNKRILMSEIEDIQKAIEMTKEFQEFEQKRIELCEKFSRKDEENNPIIKNKGLPNEGYDIEDIKSLDKELTKLRKDHKSVVDEREKQLKEYKELLDKPIDQNVDFYKISKKDLPEDITGAQVDPIIEIIED